MSLKLSPWTLAAILSFGIWGSAAACDAESGDQEKTKATVTEAEQPARAEKPTRQGGNKATVAEPEKPAQAEKPTRQGGNKATVAEPEKPARLGGNKATVAEPEKPAQAEKASVTEAEKNSVRATELSKQGIATSASVHQAEIELAEARIQLASIQGKSDEIVGNLEKLVTHREHLWKQARDLSEQGVGTVHSVGEARVQLAEARIRLEAQTTLSVRRQQFKLLEEAAKAGAVPQRRVDEARKALEDAHKRLGREKP